MGLAKAIPIATNWTTLMVSPVPAICSMPHTWMFSKKHMKEFIRLGSLTMVIFRFVVVGNFFQHLFCGMTEAISFGKTFWVAQALLIMT